jgi:polysaccharide biosynthesis transport protein
MNMASMAIDQEEQGKSFGEYLIILKRRRKPMQIVGAATLIIAILAALLWPPTYRSSATILIEEQEIPQDLVRSTITGFANQQIKVISQRIFTLANIMDIVQRYTLWDEAELKRTPRTEIMSKFQKNMKLDVISAEVMDPRYGRSTEATIAFTLSFDHRNPAVAQKVANELVNLYMNENLKSRTEKSATTASFLKGEADALNNHIREIEQKLSDFKQQNEGALPELSQYNLSVVERSTSELSDARARIAELQKRKLELQANMAQISPYAATDLPTGERALSDRDRLKALQSEFRNKSALYSADHPDVARLQREIAHLQETLGSGDSAKNYAKQLKTEQEKLAGLKQTYTPDHPEVLKQQRVVEALGKPDKNFASRESEDFQADSPAYVLLKTQLRGTETDIETTTARIAELQAKISKFEGYLSKAPNVEKNYAELTRELQTNTMKFQEIKAKQMQAELSQNLESERKGERYVLIEPPILPDDPVSPNRPVILVLGLVLAAIAAIGVAAVGELLDESVRGTIEVSAVLGSTPLGSIPYLLLAEEQQEGTRTNKWVYLGVAGAILIVVLVFHFAIKPLDVVWFIALRKLGLG